MRKTVYENARDLLLQIPPNFSGLDGLTISTEDATKLAYEYVDECWEEGISEEEPDFSYEGYLAWCWREPAAIPGLHSTYLFEVMEYLLARGADPNYNPGSDYCLMQMVCHVVNGYVAADTLRLLLENGGNPNLPFNGASLFFEIDFDVGYDMSGQWDRRVFDSLVHCWMVLIGYGGKPKNGTTPLDLFEEWGPQITGTFNTEKLRNHRNYSFVLTHAENRGSFPTIHIFDKRTFWEVARL